MTLWLAVNAAVMINRAKGEVRDFEAEYVLPWENGWTPPKFALTLVEEGLGSPPMSEDDSHPSFLKQLQDAFSETFNAAHDRTLKALEDRFGPAEPKTDRAIGDLARAHEKLRDEVKDLVARLDVMAKRHVALRGRVDKLEEERPTNVSYAVEKLSKAYGELAVRVLDLESAPAPQAADFQDMRTRLVRLEQHDARYRRVAKELAKDIGFE